jgi:RNA polymerase sigma factor (sigma-70 family)
MGGEAMNRATPRVCQIPRLPADADLADRQLLERFATNEDEAAFAELVRRHGPMVMSVCQRQLNDAHEAEDAFQATFLVLVQKARSIGRPESLGAWLHGVACRAAARARHAAVRRGRQREATVMTDGDPAVEVVWRELRQLLDEELGRLAHKYRAPMVLFYLEGKTTEEVAGQLGCPKGTVLSRLARGRDRLHQRLLRRGVATSLSLLGTVLAEQAAPAAVPTALAVGTVNAAVLTAAGQLGCGAISATVAELTKGVLQAMLLNKLKILAAMLLVLTIVGAGIGLWSRLALADEPALAGKVEATKDEQTILGTWVLASGEEGGQNAPPERLQDATVTFAEGGKMTTKQGGREHELTFKLDPAKNPKEFSATNEQGRTVLGIYKLEADTLTVCFDRNGEMPTEFASKKGTTVVLEVYKREKK